MKKTFTINISGSVFHIDEDAFEKLQRYLQMLNRHFGTALEGQEILQDIEARIAELLIEKTNNKVEVVTSEMVNDVMVRMGQPEDFMEVEEEEPAAKTQAQTTIPPVEQPIRRRLYRDGENRVLGGVCSGLSAYFNVDVVVFRIIFVLALFLAFGSVLVYIILWIAVPKAKTTAQRLEMRGMEATVSNIEKSIKEEMKEIGDNYNRFMNTPEGEKGTTRMDRMGDTLGGTFRVLLRVGVLILGIILILFAIGSLIGFVASMAIGHSFLHGGPWNFGGGPDINMGTLINHFISPGAYTISVIAISLLAGIPILVLLFIGTKLIFRYHTNNRVIGLISFAVWLVALITLVFVGVNQAQNFSKQTSQTMTQKVECATCKTIYLDVNDDLYASMIEEHISLDRMKVAEVNGKEKLLGHPSFTIEKSANEEFLLQVKKRSRGNSNENALQNMEQIDYNFTQKDSTLLFDPYYILKDNAKWRNQEVNMVLKVPQGKSVFLGEKMKAIINDIENTNNIYDDDMVGKYWTMTPEGLTLRDSIPANTEKQQIEKQGLKKIDKKKISFELKI
ncbi:MAG TPA: PspC domain-containing protein [Prolixibacteraceae bacterium]|nr:PspC domain-containing protein [Prolixibacteraceae bacterium]